MDQEAIDLRRLLRGRTLLARGQDWRLKSVFRTKGKLQVSMERDAGDITIELVVPSEEVKVS